MCSTRPTSPDEEQEGERLDGAASHYMNDAGEVVWEAIRQEQRADPAIGTVIKHLLGVQEGSLEPLQLDTEFKSMWKHIRDYSLSEKTVNDEIPEGILFYGGRVVLPSSLRGRVIEQIHGLGHKGIVKTADQLRHLYFWPGMLSTVIDYINSCPQCMLRQKVNLKEMHYHPLATVHGAEAHRVLRPHRSGRRDREAESLRLNVH